jgi:hypothetical protein
MRIKFSNLIQISTLVFACSLNNIYAVWQWPTVSKIITSDFGPRISPITNSWDFHEGIDIYAEMNTSVYAAEAGEVIFVGGDYGMIIINHGKMISRYLHLDLSKPHVNVGDIVIAGQEIGKSGKTSPPDKPVSPHLHFDFDNSPNWPHPLKYLPYNDTCSPTVSIFKNIRDGQILSGEVEIQTLVLTTVDKDLNEFYLYYQPVYGSLTEINHVKYDPFDNCFPSTVEPDSTVVGSDTFKISWDTTKLSDGRYNISGYAYDAKRKFDTKIVQVIVDNQPPTGSIVINNDATYTNTTSVVLTLYAVDAGTGVAYMQFSNDNVTWSDWEKVYYIKIVEFNFG